MLRVKILILLTVLAAYWVLIAQQVAILHVLIALMGALSVQVQPTVLLVILTINL